MRKFYSIYFFNIIFTLAIISCSNEDTLSPVSTIPPVFNGFGDIQDVMEYNNITGVSIAIINNSEIDTLMVFGVIDKKTMEPVTEETVFQAASISKSFTSVLALRYVEEGILLLDDDFNNYLVSWQIPENEFTVNNKVTLRGLLSHTSGMSVDNGNGFDQRYSIPTLMNILKGELPAISDPVAVETVPGSNFNYPNIGYEIIQLALTDIRGISFTQMMDEKILAPLQMANSLFAISFPKSSSLVSATGYWGDGTEVNGGYYVYPVLGPSGLWCTPRDLAKFVIEIQKTISGTSNLLISQTNANLMIELVTQFDSSVGYALGYSTHLLNSEKYFAHGGHTKGFRSRFFSHELSGNGMVIMTNSDEEGNFIDRVIEIVGEKYDWPGF